MTGEPAVLVRAGFGSVETFRVVKPTIVLGKRQISGNALHSHTHAFPNNAHCLPSPMLLLLWHVRALPNVCNMLFDRIVAHAVPIYADA